MQDYSPTSYSSIGKKVFRNFKEKSLNKDMKKADISEGNTIIVSDKGEVVLALVKRTGNGKWYAETKSSIIPLQFCNIREFWVCKEALKKL